MLLKGGVATPSTPPLDPPLQPLNPLWLVKCLILRVRNFKCIFSQMFTFVPTDFAPTFLLCKVFK